MPDGDAALICFDDRWQGRQCQDLATELGDFVLRRADGLWAYPAGRGGRRCAIRASRISSRGRRPARLHAAADPTCSICWGCRHRRTCTCRW
ncbi:hypothetical protein ACU4GD_19780 [Cupriavidus basilensis]